MAMSNNDPYAGSMQNLLGNYANQQSVDYETHRRMAEMQQMQQLKRQAANTEPKPNLVLLLCD